MNQLERIYSLLYTNSGSTLATDLELIKNNMPRALDDIEARIHGEGGICDALKTIKGMAGEIKTFKH